MTSRYNIIKITNKKIHFPKEMKKIKLQKEKWMISVGNRAVYNLERMAKC